jgi:G3E family GTPase
MWCAGKTTILRALLSQNKYKIGCVVNDVAAVNIDAKLIRNQNNTDEKTNTTSDLAPTIELQNGCACAPSLLSVHRLGPQLARDLRWAPQG